MTQCMFDSPSGNEERRSLFPVMPSPPRRGLFRHNTSELLGLEPVIGSSDRILLPDDFSNAGPSQWKLMPRKKRGGAASAESVTAAALVEPLLDLDLREDRPVTPVTDEEVACSKQESHLKPRQRRFSSSSMNGYGSATEDLASFCNLHVAKKQKLNGPNVLVPLPKKAAKQKTFHALSA